MNCMYCNVSNIHYFFLLQQDVVSEGESTDEEIDARPFSGRKCSSVPIEETGIELQTVKCHRSESEEVDKGINFSLSRPQVLFSLQNVVKVTMTHNCKLFLLSMQW